MINEPQDETYCIKIENLNLVRMCDMVEPSKRCLFVRVPYSQVLRRDRVGMLAEIAKANELGGGEGVGQWLFRVPNSPVVVVSSPFTSSMQLNEENLTVAVDRKEGKINPKMSRGMKMVAGLP